MSRNTKGLAAVAACGVGPSWKAAIAVFQLGPSSAIALATGSSATMATAAACLQPKA
ncbi:MAG: hypothetical protein ACK46X_18660 [Candidatus Sericytochromatia bacterium]